MAEASDVHISALAKRISALESECTTTTTPDDIRSSLFAAQLDAFDCAADRLHLLCGRRAGKTTVIAARASSVCLRPGRNVVYIARTLRNAKKIVFPELRRVAAANKIAISFRFSNDDVSVRFGNGSEVLFMGVRSVDRIEDIRGYGRGVDLVCVDECGTYPDWLGELVEDAAHPLTADCGGKMLLAGSPGRVLDGYWYDATRHDTAHAWPVQRWTMTANPHIQDGGLADGTNQAAVAWLADYRTQRGIDETDAAYRREWLGEWCRDTTALVFDYDADRNSVSTLPEEGSLH